jgi:hypothetical protein
MSCSPLLPLVSVQILLSDELPMVPLSNAFETFEILLCSLGCLLGQPLLLLLLEKLLCC